MITSVSAVMAGIVLPMLLHQYSRGVILAAQLFLLNTPVGALLAVSRATFEATGKFAISTRSQWLIPLFNLVGLLLLLPFHVFTPALAGAVYVFGSAPVVFWLLRELWREYRPCWRFEFSSARTLLSYGIRSYGSDLCGTLSLYVDQALVVGMLNARAMGIYAVALSLSRMLSVFSASVTMVLFPKVAGLARAEIVEVTGRAARLSTACTAFFGVGLFLTGPAALHLLYGSKYAEADSVLRVLIIEVVLASATSVLAQAAMGLGRPGVVTLLQSIGLCLTIPLMFVFVPHFGILGAGFSLLISSACRLVFMISGFDWFLGCKCPRLTLTRSDYAFAWNDSNRRRLRRRFGCADGAVLSAPYERSRNRRPRCQHGRRR